MSGDPRAAGAPAASSTSYADPSLAAVQGSFDRLVAEGASPGARRRFIVDNFTARNRSIRDLDFRKLNPRTIERDYLLPRKDLYSFVLSNWVRHIFLPGLKPAVSRNLLMFGLGRMFSTYNDLGVQCNTDADFNIVVGDSMAQEDVTRVGEGLGVLAREINDHFGISIEINPAFTLLRERQVLANLSLPDPDLRRKHALFYKSNERSIIVFQDNERIRKAVFDPVRALPDSYLFEHYLGLGSAKPSFLKLRMDVEPLPLLQEGSGDKALARNVIGSIAFAQYCRSTFPRGLFVSPPDWIFSMKYFVNRVYDYVCAMRNAGHGLDAVGLGGAAEDGSPDPDFAFLRTAHKLMLYLQELIQISTRTFGSLCDFTYMSRARFLRLMELDGEKFRRDFEDMALGGGLLQPSNAAKYRELKARIAEKARDRFVEGRSVGLERLPPDFEYELVFRDGNAYKICVPYSWADLGFFAFSAIASRVVQIVESRLVPAARSLAAGAQARRAARGN